MFQHGRKGPSSLQTRISNCTQTLESMVDNAQTTCAEASDVFNDTIDGADAVMISGEASVSNYPIQAVQVMGEIVRCAQNQKNPSDHGAIAEDVCMAVHTFAERFEKSTRTEKSIILVGSGFVARSLAKYRLVFASHACLFRRGTRTV